MEKFSNNSIKNNKKSPASPENTEDFVKGKRGKKKRFKNKVFLIVMVLIIIALAVLLWFIFNREPSFTGERVHFSLVGPDNIQTGAPMYYRLTYRNEENVSLKDVEISLVYPDGFVFDSSDPTSENFEENKWVISEILPGSFGEVKINGKIFGNKNDDKKCIAVLHYTPANVNTSFRLESQFTTNILGADLDISSDFPKIVSQDEKLNYDIKVRNEESYDLTNVRVRLNYPSGFEFETANPEPLKENNLWHFDRIASKEEVSINITEKVFGELGEEKTLNIEAGIIDSQENYFKQNENKFVTKISKIDADLDYTVNGEKDLTVNPGDLLEFKLHYKNTSTENLPDVTVETEIDKELFDESSILVEGGNYTVGKIVWNKIGVSSFKNLEKDSEGDLMFKAKIKDEFTTESTNNPIIKSKATIKSYNEDTGVDFSKESNEVQAKIGTVIKVDSQGRYYDFNNQMVGSGPLPPKVGETTKYRIYLTVSNTTNEVSESTVEVYLPQGVSWTGTKNVDLGDLVFLGDRLVWNLGKIDPNIGGSLPEISADFEIGITPNDDQVGKNVTLVKKIVFSGNDTNTGNIIKLESDPITSDLKNDPVAKGKGVVVR